METEIIRINMDKPLEPQLERAALILRSGGTVAFPTETVYGLGANALDGRAVEGIFKAKGRPSDNPLIVHIAMQQGERPRDAVLKSGLVKSVPHIAEVLMDRFWPGPLTLVMPRSEKVPKVVTAGLDTVGIRMPVHPVAVALIRLSGVPVAAPSANTSGKPSPTIAQHVIDDLYGKVNAIIDGGSCDVGLESTVVDTTGKRANLLRPGGVTAEQLRDVLGEIDIDAGVLKAVSPGTVPRSPGMKYKHYSPKAEVTIVKGQKDAMESKILEMAGKMIADGKKVGILATEQTLDCYLEKLADHISEGRCHVISVGNREKPITIAEHLFGYLRRFDALGVDAILAEAVDSSGIGLAIMNRMNRAAGFRIIEADSHEKIEP